MASCAHKAKGRKSFLRFSALTKMAVEFKELKGLCVIILLKTDSRKTELLSHSLMREDTITFRT